MRGLPCETRCRCKRHRRFHGRSFLNPETADSRHSISGSGPVTRRSGYKFPAARFYPRYRKSSRTCTFPRTSSRCSECRYPCWRRETAARTDSWREGPPLIRRFRHSGRRAFPHRWPSLPHNRDNLTWCGQGQARRHRTLRSDKDGRENPRGRAS